MTNEVLRALHGRRSMSKVRPELPPREAIEEMLHAAVQAPNHHRTEPWRFVVVTGAARNELGEVMARSLAERFRDESEEERAALLTKERNKPLRAPVVIAVAAVTTGHPKAIEEEDVAATAAAVENMLLAAPALGLGAMWRTGKPARDPAVKAWLGLPPDARIVAFVYVGYPDLPELPPRSRMAEPHTRWIGWDQTGAE